MVMHHTKGLTGACMMMLCSLWLAVALKVGGRGGEGGGAFGKEKKIVLAIIYTHWGSVTKIFIVPRKLSTCLPSTDPF